MVITAREAAREVREMMEEAGILDVTVRGRRVDFRDLAGEEAIVVTVYGWTKAHQERDGVGARKLQAWARGHGYQVEFVGPTGVQG